MPISAQFRRATLPEELAEVEDLVIDRIDRNLLLHRLCGHRNPEYKTEQQNLSLPGFLINLREYKSSSVAAVQGESSKAAADLLAVFGMLSRHFFLRRTCLQDGAMPGDGFLHQLQRAFGEGWTHHHYNHLEENDEHSQLHAHCIQDHSLGLSVLLGIILFLIVEKVVRYVEENSTKEVHGQGHGCHHHIKKKLMDESEHSEELSTHVVGDKTRYTHDTTPRRCHEMADLISVELKVILCNMAPIFGRLTILKYWLYQN